MDTLGAGFCEVLPTTVAPATPAIG